MIGDQPFHHCRFYLFDDTDAPGRSVAQNILKSAQDAEECVPGPVTVAAELEAGTGKGGLFVKNEEKAVKLFNGVTDVGDDLIEEAGTVRKRKKTPGGR